MTNPTPGTDKTVLDGWLGVYQISIQQIFGAEAPCFDDVRGREGKWGSLYYTVLYDDSWVPGCCYELFRH